MAVDPGEAKEMESVPRDELYKGSPASVTLWIPAFSAQVRFEICPGKSADNARRLAVLLMTQAEHVDPKGYDIVCQASEVKPCVQ